MSAICFKIGKHDGAIHLMDEWERCLTAGFLKSTSYDEMTKRTVEKFS